MPRFCLALSLRQDPKLIAEYIEHHRHVPEAIKQSIREAGVLDMQIYQLGTQLFMIMDTSADFSFERKAEMDRSNPAVLDWEQLMSKYQDVSDTADPVGRWQRMEQVFGLIS